MNIHVGTSGWSYDHWTGVLYPPGTPAGERLRLYTGEFTTVELNASFYRWPRPTTFASWRQRLPAGFTMSVKAPRGLTHAKRLRDPATWLERIGAGLHELGPRRGVLLIQIAPNHQRDDARLHSLLERVPSWIRVAVELRHPSWHAEPVFALLEQHRAAFCVVSGAQLPCVLRATAPFVYVRLHGPDPDHLYRGAYSDADLRWWAARIGEWCNAGLEVFAYFNNDGEGNAVRNARTLRTILGDDRG